MRRSLRVIMYHMRHLVLLICALAHVASSLVPQDNNPSSLKCQQCLDHCTTSRQSGLRQLLCEHCLIVNCHNRWHDLATFFLNYQCAAIPKQPVTSNTNCHHPSCLQEGTPTQSPEEAREMERMLEKHRSRFMDEGTLLVESIQMASQPTNEYRTPTLRSGAFIDDHERQVCPTTFRVIQPGVADHTSGTRVQLWSYRGLRQFFYVGSCTHATPPVDMHPPGSCKTVKTLHKAMFIITKEQKEKTNAQFLNCSPMGSSKAQYMCDDWVKMDASCALFV